MVIKKIQVGTGITEKPIVQISPPYSAEDIAVLEGFVRRWNADREAAGNQLGAAVWEIVKLSRSILSSAGDGPIEADSQPDYASRILQGYKTAQACIKKGEADQAALAAFFLGDLCSKAILKFTWEVYALQGKDRAQAWNETSSIANAGRHRRQSATWHACQKEAEAVWAGHPAYSKNSVAKIVCDRLGIAEKPDTIARRLKKPRKAVRPSA